MIRRPLDVVGLLEVLERLDVGRQGAQLLERGPDLATVGHLAPYGRRPHGRVT